MRTEASVNGNIVHKFDSMKEVISYTSPEYFTAARKSFVGEDLPSWEKVVSRTERVWAEGMYIMRQFVERLEKEAIPQLKSKKRKTEWSYDEGDEVDLDKMRQGEAFMRSSKREESTGATEVTIITDTTTPYTVDSTDVLWRGAAALALTKILEDKGYRAELWVVNGSRLYAGKSVGVCTSCCMKRTSDPLDTSSLINTVAGWFYRTVTFALLRSICAKHGERPASGLGSCYEPRAAELDLISRDQNRIYSSGTKSFHGAVDMIRGELKKIGADKIKGKSAK